MLCYVLVVGIEVQASFVNHSFSNSSLAIGLSLQSNIMISPINSLSILHTSFSVVLLNGVVLDCGISCIRYRIAVMVSGLAISSYLAGKGPKYWNCRLRTSNPYSSWPKGTAWRRNKLKFPPYIRLISCVGRSARFIHSTRDMFERTKVPKDQISVAVFQGVSIITSGLVHICAPTGVPDLAYSESSRHVPPRSLSWTSENRISPSR